MHTVYLCEIVTVAHHIKKAWQVQTITFSTTLICTSCFLIRKWILTKRLPPFDFATYKDLWHCLNSPPSFVTTLALLTTIFVFIFQGFSTCVVQIFLLILCLSLMLSLRLTISGKVNCEEIPYKEHLRWGLITHHVEQGVLTVGREGALFCEFFFLEIKVGRTQLKDCLHVNFGFQFSVDHFNAGCHLNRILNVWN